MTARELYHAGQLGAAIQALGAELRDNPMDVRRRTFLFELLCFAGEYDRAQKHLDVLAEQGPDSAAAVLPYRAALNADRMRSDLFARRDYPEVHAPDWPVSGTLNGQPFESIEDADPRVGPRLEIFTAGQCMWLPLSLIDSVEMEAPKHLRDLLWAPALVRTAAAFEGPEPGGVLMPALCPLSFRQQDEAVKLGRSTVWEEQENGDVIPFGQKMLLVDGEEFPFLELRHLEIAAAADASVQRAPAQ
jgi:type VI secretion system protein ImpE